MLRSTVTCSASRDRWKRYREVGKIVAILMGMSGGVLLDIAPPAHYLASDPELVQTRNHGVAGVLVFALYFLIYRRFGGAVCAREAYRRAVVAFVFGAAVLVVYLGLRGTHVVGSGGDEYLVGFWRNYSWIEANEDWSSLANGELFKFAPWGYTHGEVWLPFSRWTAYVTLQSLYTVSIFSLFSAVFILWDGSVVREL